MYSDKFKIEAHKLMKRLWGEQFYSPKEKKWSKECTDGYVRGFTQYILDPIYKVCILVRSNHSPHIRGGWEGEDGDYIYVYCLVASSLKDSHTQLTEYHI